MNHERFVSFCLYAGLFANRSDVIEIYKLLLHKKKEQWPMMKYQHLDDSK